MISLTRSTRSEGSRTRSKPIGMSWTRPSRSHNRWHPKHRFHSKEFSSPRLEVASIKVAPWIEAVLKSWIKTVSSNIEIEPIPIIEWSSTSYFGPVEFLPLTNNLLPIKQFEYIYKFPSIITYLKSN